MPLNRFALAALLGCIMLAGCNEIRQFGEAKQPIRHVCRL